MHHAHRVSGIGHWAANSGWHRKYSRIDLHHHWNIRGWVLVGKEHTESPWYELVAGLVTQGVAEVGPFADERDNKLIAGPDTDAIKIGLREMTAEAAENGFHANRSDDLYAVAAKRDISWLVTILIGYHYSLSVSRRELSHIDANW